MENRITYISANGSTHSLCDMDEGDRVTVRADYRINLQPDRDYHAQYVLEGKYVPAKDGNDAVVMCTITADSSPEAISTMEYIAECILRVGYEHTWRESLVWRTIGVIGVALTERHIQNRAKKYARELVITLKCTGEIGLVTLTGKPGKMNMHYTDHRRSRKGSAAYATLPELIDEMDLVAIYPA